MYVCTYVCIGIDKENHKLTKNSLVIIVTFKSSHGFMGTYNIRNVKNVFKHQKICLQVELHDFVCEHSNKIFICKPA